MHVSEGVFWAFFAIVAIFMVAAWFFMSPRSERVGSLTCPFHSKMGGSRMRLTIAREGDHPTPVVQVHVRMTGMNVAYRLGVADARQLATLLETAVGRIGSP